MQSAECRVQMLQQQDGIRNAVIQPGEYELKQGKNTNTDLFLPG